MKSYGVNELRQMFLDFFASKEHLILKSFSLVPNNDKSLLLINSGMAPMKPYFTGQEIPPKRRVATCQKCIRTGDIENVGKTARHGTFFEMLGNFSFGDYFKKESIGWTWEFLTEVIGLDKDRLYPSVYLEDDEAWDIWHNQIGIPENRIFRFGKADNFWEHGAGPCGPCSEVYYDRGEQYGCDREDCTVGCDCDRYMEIWNNVFTQFNNDGENHYTELEQKNIDTGMGLERLACIVQEVDSMFDIDTMKALRDHVCKLSGKEYGRGGETDVSTRVITDHIRSVTFMISDGIMPSNEGRGYVLRRLLRRACRHGKLLGISGEFLVDLAKTVVEGSKDGYPELAEKQFFIYEVIAKEEELFAKTIDQGLTILADLREEMRAEKRTILKGEEAFRLYDTYGFPLDLTKEILEEQGLSVDEEGFSRSMEIQRETARKAREKTSLLGADMTVYESIDPSVTSSFVGYENTEFDSEILVMTTEDHITDRLSQGEKGTVFVKETPFYATSGGQEADTGWICTDTGRFVVEDVKKLSGGKIGHVGYLKEGAFQKGDRVHLAIDKERRMLAANNHSATHLLHKALKSVLGNHVEQAGSLVNAERLRFDFTHFSALSKEELVRIEAIVNRQILENLSVSVETMPIQEAKKTGAAALFGEKYGDMVRVVRMGEFSIELCGGTHVSHTGMILAFKILSETGVAAGVRRIEALTAKGLLEYYAEIERSWQETASLLKVSQDRVTERTASLLEENKKLHAEIESYKSQQAKDVSGNLLDQVKEVGGIRFLAARADGMDMNGLREIGDQCKETLKEAVILLLSEKDQRVSLVAMATDDAVKKGAHAGNLIKSVAPLVGGGGGGRPSMAQAGGKNPAGMAEAMEKAEEILRSQLKDL
ncbi:alanine--tRNA ligase [Clostridiaceae bacterium 68-1-5]|uniref:Alanine--tRNA ligase n=1 Tax=Suipraeoptans intestinalis TaxID=2606628 RepID=A0A6N7UQV0_9FIRM|nr:alanine--tRNA ligase [Suipraeoptans intestinalis]MSR92933.1 alanine--tRNA ligase [Suipraeoptans intestinalis]